MNQSSQDKASFWSNHLHAQRESELTQQAYCKQHTLKPHQFWYWRRKLQGSGQSQIPDKSVNRRFVPIKVATSSLDKCLTITLPNGTRISGIEQHNHLLAQQLIGALK